MAVNVVVAVGGSTTPGDGEVTACVRVNVDATGHGLAGELLTARAAVVGRPQGAVACRARARAGAVVATEGSTRRSGLTAGVAIVGWAQGVVACRTGPTRAAVVSPEVAAGLCIRGNGQDDDDDEKRQRSYEQT